MSFAMTQRQFRARTKTHTRRLGWENAKPGELVRGVEKGQGLKKGEKVQSMGVIRFLDVARERLDTITPEGVVREGFPGMSPAEFVVMFCAANRPCQPDWRVTRIAFEYVDEE
jgi:hypothetical protein